MHRAVYIVSAGNRSHLERKQTLEVAYRSPGKLPEGVRIYAVGDIHGRADLLDRVFAKIDADSFANPRPRQLEAFLGDYVDRGPHSKDVIEQLIQRSRLRQTIFLRGNHEDFIFEFLRSPTVLANWRQNGGLETLLSYGLRPSLNPDDAVQAKLATEFADLIPETQTVFPWTETIVHLRGYFLPTQA